MADPSQKKAPAADAAIDLRTVGVTEGVEAAPQELPEPFKERPYDPSPARENIRGRIALLLIWTMVVVIGLVTIVAILTTTGCLKEETKCADDAVNLTSLRVLVELILTPLVGLVGAVTGFYFGEKSVTSPSPQGEPTS